MDFYHLVLTWSQGTPSAESVLQKGKRGFSHAFKTQVVSMQWLSREYLPCFAACQVLAVFSKVVNSPNIF